MKSCAAPPHAPVGSLVLGSVLVTEAHDPVRTPAFGPAAEHDDEERRQRLFAVGSLGTVFQLSTALVLAAVGNSVLAGCLLASSCLSAYGAVAGRRRDRHEWGGHAITAGLLLNLGSVVLLTVGTAAGNLTPLILVPVVGQLLIQGSSRHVWSVATLLLLVAVGVMQMIGVEPWARVPFMEAPGSLLQGTVAAVLVCTLVMGIWERSRQETLLRLRESEERAYRVIEVSPDPICITRRSAVVFANQASQELFGREFQSGTEVPYADLLAKAPDPEGIDDVVARLEAGERFVNYELALQDAAGRPRQIHVRTTRIEIRGKQHSLHILRDVTEENNERRALALVHAITTIANEGDELDEALRRGARALMEALEPAALLYWRPQEPGSDVLEATVLETRENVSADSGWLLERSASPWVVGSDIDRECFLGSRSVFESPDRVLGVRDGGSDATGARRASLLPIRTREETVGLLECIEDAESMTFEGSDVVLADVGLHLGRVAERECARADISRLAYFDSLTGLPNREHFRRALEEGLAACDERSEKAALLFVDLDGFKQVNDSMGHSAGDRMLRDVARRLRGSVRLSDLLGRGPGDAPGTIARLGGDEFTVLLADAKTPEGVRKVAERILGALESPMQIDGKNIHMTASIGIAMYPADATDAGDLLRAADSAMYEAKDQGRNGFHFFNQNTERNSSRRLQLKGMLRDALNANEFRLVYQPILDAGTEAVISAEALIRWTTAEGEEVSPGEFIPIAEKEGMIAPIGAWVIHGVAQQVRAWREDGYRTVPVAVNVSASQLWDPDFVSTTCEVLEQNGLEPSALSMEITETAILHDGDATAATLTELRELGFRLVLDDFGTGFSSLSALQRVPFHSLKIDRSFVSKLPNPSDEAIVSAIVGMGHGLHARVVAEGVETEEQLAVLRGYECDSIQGYLFSRPVPQDEFAAFLVRKVRN